MKKSERLLREYKNCHYRTRFNILDTIREEVPRRQQTFHWLPNTRGYHGRIEGYTTWNDLHPGSFKGGYPCVLWSDIHPHTLPQRVKSDTQRSRHLSKRPLQRIQV